MSAQTVSTAIIVPPNEGRVYSIGPMPAVFKADLCQTNSAISVSEWWLKPDTEGPHAHAHPETHVFYVIAGTLAVFLYDRGWPDAERGSYIYILGGTENRFKNRSDARVGFIAINTLGGFEASLPRIAEYFQDKPLGAASNRT